MKKQWKLDNKGMTLLEVIVAFAIFAIAATILITGFGGALRVMGNSEAIKDASQKNASGLESPLEIINEAGYKVETLTEPGSLNVETGKGTFSIEGNYKIATANKKNDPSETMSMMLFDAKVLSKPDPEPEPEPPSSGIPEVPVLDNNDAYFNPDTRKKEIIKDPDNGSENEEDITYFSKFDGSFRQGQFDPTGYYITEVGENLHKGVITNSITVQWQMIVMPNEHLRQMFFYNNNPLNFQAFKGEALYVIDFLYLGSDNGKTNVIKICRNTYNAPSRLILRPYKYREEEKEYLVTDKIFKDHLVTFYLPKQLEIQVYDNIQYEGIPSSKTIPAGYYQVPSGTDILKAAYDEKEYKKYVEPKSVNKDSYQRTYADVKDSLVEYGVTMKNK